MAWRSGFDYGYFPPSVPRAAKGGIKARSQRGSFGESWWARRWIAVLESFQMGARLRRGRSYARSGQVLGVEIESGLVRAKVQGSRPTPYSVSLRVKALTPASWTKVAAVLVAEARLLAKLLAGEMPEDVETAFTAAKLSLFPERRQDLQTECSCPDWSNPCKHIAAVYYLLGEEFDRDPFLIFQLRGATREDLLRRLASAGPRRKQATAAPEAEAEPAPATAPVPLGADPATFWDGPGLPAPDVGPVQVPEEPAALLKRLRSFPFWRGRAPLVTALELTYARASARGLDAIVGTRSEDEAAAS